MLPQKRKVSGPVLETQPCREGDTPFTIRKEERIDASEDAFQGRWQKVKGGSRIKALLQYEMMNLQWHYFVLFNFLLVLNQPHTNRGGCEAQEDYISGQVNATISLIDTPAPLASGMGPIKEPHLPTTWIRPWGGQVT